ncbi:hypothetical protein M9H77_20948 [Catharanthus roseus]|uniref:Uncharacterized protein n=1 Tax=Catharanthus roseus TaxID=4058 RepID=A0ACC0AMZ0_CATRO|nr:hypothetical protein M9H77_20948 [Catharanthus roseus]
MYMSIFGSVERVYELIRKTIRDEGPAPYEHWLDTLDHLYVIGNTFNFCVVLIARLGSTTVLSLYSNMNCTAEMLCTGFISDQQHFIQAIKSNKAQSSIGGQLERESHKEYSLDSVAEEDCEGGTTAYNHQCKHSEEERVHWSMSLSIDATVPQATILPQISS